MSIIDFSSNTFDPTLLPTFTSEQLNEIPFGVTSIDDNGIITRYNAYNIKNFSIDLPTQCSLEWTLGKGFFTDIAPCCNNKMVKGRFDRGVLVDAMDVTFDYVFTFKIEPVAVKMRLFRDPATSTNWILVRKR